MTEQITDCDRGGEKQRLEIAQNAVVRLMCMEALVDEAIGKMKALACTVDLPEAEGEIFDTVTGLLYRMKKILDGAGDQHEDKNNG